MQLSTCPERNHKVKSREAIFRFRLKGYKDDKNSSYPILESPSVESK